jgi:hypothetical protein
VEIPPPASLEMFPLTVVSLSVRAPPLLWIPPPAPSALLPLTVELVSVRESPALEMPPPLVALPSRVFRLLMAAVASSRIEKTLLKESAERVPHLGYFRLIYGKLTPAYPWANLSYLRLLGIRASHEARARHSMRNENRGCLGSYLLKPRLIPP